MFEKIEGCPVCNSSEFENHIICKDHTTSKESFVIVKCSNCDFLFTNPRPTKESIAKYYESSKYISHTNSSTNLTDILYQIVRGYSLNNKLTLLKKHSTGNSLLDFGSGTGHFLNKAMKKGWNIKGFEPGSKVNILPRIKPNVTSNLSDIENCSNFDVITMWHVLEHVHDLNITIDLLRTKLNSSGKMFIAVPNPLSYDAQVFKENWAAYDVPRHLYHFTKSTISKLLNKHKLKVVEIKPMLFDSFYVSLLSNEYKYGKRKYINSFITGYKSNTYGNKTQEHSSHIYIVSHK